MVEIIDEGFFGSVFLALVGEKKRPCVVKMSKEEDGNLLEEINLMARIDDHENIVKLIGVFVDLMDEGSKGLRVQNPPNFFGTERWSGSLEKIWSGAVERTFQKILIFLVFFMNFS